MVGFNYRRVPATRARPAHGRRRAGSARLRHVRVTYLQDWLVDPEFPLTWRLRKEAAGSGALGDLGAHIVDLAQYLAGEPLAGVSALTETFVRERPLPGGPTSGLTARPRPPATGGHRGRRRRLHRPPHVGGARLLRGHPVRRPAARTPCASSSTANAARWPSTWSGSTSCPSTTTPDPARTRASAASSSPSPTTPTWTPGGRRATASATSTPSSTRPATCVHAIADGHRPRPSFADGLQVQRVLAAVEESAEKNSVYTPVPVSSTIGLRRLDEHARDRSRSSPASGPTCRSKRSAASPATSATTVSNSPAGATTSRSTRPSRTPAIWTGRHQLLDKYGLKCWAISNHLVGQAVCDDHHRRTPPGASCPPASGATASAEGVRQRAAAEIADTARAAAAFGVDTVIGFTGSSIWHLVAMFPPVPPSR